jgi:hypothetical protein
MFWSREQAASYAKLPYAVLGSGDQWEFHGFAYFTHQKD